ncbi:TonB-dependent receptor [Altererythrobacter arenosus]|uniref:TonB-dependent receptor n=1 Tax=Altererythrobacter arenosus TaxID=3032592 RepID=A0ABY8FNG0_9SPHN|nr:TonB-dependent receptor [Altererythrobacter sp. CAU 1644]WFL76397.1 TonB-dependent receptor [Altererythrobacter sp. CAU 1644]
MTKFKTQLACGAALGVMLVAAPVQAQDADSGTGVANDENTIIVTARRQNEQLQDVPASVAVITADALEKTGADNAEDFVQLTPGVTIVTGTAEAGDTQVNIRGINGARDAESSIALVVDGILKTNTAQLNQTQGTLRQVEILKGPQGALYGRNAAAGAIVLSTLKPSDYFEGGAKVSYANEDTIEGTAHIAGPLGENLGFVLSGYYRTTDGFFRNIFTDTKNVDDQEVWSVDGRLVANLGDATEVDVKARYSQLRGASINFNAAFHLPEFAAFNPAFYEDVNKHQFRYYNNIDPSNDQDSFDVSAKIEHDFGNTTLTAWALYSDVDQSLVADGTSADFARYIPFPAPTQVAADVAADCFVSTAGLTGFPVNQPGFIGQTPVPFLFDPATGSTFGPYSPTTCDGTQYQIRKQTDISAEVRLASNTDGPLSWQLGLYYLNIDREVGVSLGADTGAGVIEELYNAPTTANPTSLLLADSFDTNVYAAFGNFEYDMGDFTAGLALRYDIEDRKTSSLVPNVVDPITGGPINPGQAFGSLDPASKSFKQLQPKVSLSWQPSANANIYANWGIGFKSGGFNNQGSATIIDQNFNQFIGAGVTIEDQYDKEVSSAFEVGVKGSFADGRITYDLAGYYTEIDDMQFFEFFVGPFGLLRVVSNIDEVEVMGAELNVTARIIDGWKFYGAVNVTDSEIKKNVSRPYTVGNKSPYTADYTLNFGTEIDTPLTDNTDLIVRADYRVTGPTWFHTVQDQERPTLFTGLIPISAVNFLPAEWGNARYDVAKRDAFGVLNVRGGVEIGNFSIFAFGENVLNKKYVAEVIPAIEFGGSFISPGGRALYGVEVGYKF